MSPARRFGLVVLIPFVALFAAGCVDGYPSDDVPRTTAMSEREHLRALNRFLEDPKGGQRLWFEMAGPCELTLRSKPPLAAGAEAIALRGIEADLRMDKASERYVVELVHGPNPAARRMHAFEVDGWFDAVAFRSHVRQLQVRCLDEAGKPA